MIDMKKEAALTQDKLKDSLTYDPGTGVFTWNQYRPGRKRDRPAGSLRRRGYRTICIDGHIYKAHRLAWFYMTGKWPKDQIDHINQDKSDNRFDNLREANSQENGRNCPLTKANTSGHVGVSRFKRTGKWRARLTLDNKDVHLGYFDNIEDAISARVQANIEHGFHENHGNAGT